MGGRTQSGHDAERCWSGDGKQPAPVGPEPLGSEPVVRSRVARSAARLGGCMRVMEEPGGRFAHGFLRRTGDAGSVTARGGDRNVSGGLDPIPIQRRTAWATRLARVRGEPARPGLLPHCDASRARPSKKRPSRYSRAYRHRQEQSENITLPATFLSPLTSSPASCR